MERLNNDIIDSIAETSHELIFGDNKDFYNLSKYLEEFGIDIAYSFIEPSGYMKIIDGERPQIVVKYTDSKTRQRFTMAHELGHLLMHYKWLPESKLKGKENEIVEVTMHRHGTYETNEESEREKQANRFAASFLMPEQGIYKLLKDNQTGNESLSFDEAARLVAEYYCTSEESSKYRLQNLLNMDNRVY